MAIEHIRFQNCDACGQRFRDYGRLISHGKVLCDRCRILNAESPEELEPERLPEISEEELFSADLDIDSLDLPAAGEAAEEESGPSMEEIAARTRARHRRRSGDHPAAQRLRWPIYAGFALLLAVIGVISLWNARVKGRQMTAENGGTPLAAPTPVLPVPGLPNYEEARNLARRFVGEGDLDALLGMIRPFPGMEREVGAFLEKNTPQDGAAEMLSDMPPVIQKRIVHQSFGLLLPDGTGRLVQVVKTPTGLKVDFKAYVEWCSVPLDALMAGEVQHADEIRGILRPSTYYNFEFSSSEQYEAYSVTLSGRRDTLTVYIPRGGEFSEPLRRAMRQVGMHPATFSIRGVGESHTRRQFLLTDLKAIGFVDPEEAAVE